MNKQIDNMTEDSQLWFFFCSKNWFFRNVLVVNWWSMIRHIWVLHQEFIGMKIVYAVESVIRNWTNVQLVLWIVQDFLIAKKIFRSASFEYFYFYRIDSWSLTLFRRLYHQCFACQKNLHRNDLVQRVRSNMYHADCFRCEECQKCLQTGDGKLKQNCSFFYIVIVDHLFFSFLEFTLSSDNRILCRNDFESLINGNHLNEKLKTLDCQKLLNSTNIIGKHERSPNELNKINSNENTTRSTNIMNRKKSSRISSQTKLNSSVDDLDSNDERHKSTDDSSSLSPNASSSQQLTTSNPERRPRRDKQQRVRTVLTEKQLHLLKSCYAYNARPDALLKEQLAEMTELSPRVIRVWFQNKR